MIRPTRRWQVIAMAALCALAVGVLGTLSTDLGVWYAGLKQPDWKPPDAWFGPIWTAIFACAALSGASAWRAADHPSQRKNLALLWSANAFFNVLWSLLFFRLRRPDWAFIEVFALWATIVLLIAVSARRSRAAAWLLVPYLVWVSTAALLNLSVVRLNAPFGGG
jgi:tryptophan-rich sensory protein